MRRVTGLAALLLLAAVPALAAAQPPTRGFISAGVLYQVSENKFNQNVTFTVYSEDGKIQGGFQGGRGVRYDGGLGLRLWGRFGVGGAVSLFRKDSTAAITGSVPQPFFFDEFRTATATATAHRSDIDIHGDVLVFLVDSKQFFVVVGGGPSFALLHQELATDLLLTDVYPYDTVGISSVVLTQVNGHGFGGNAMASIAWRVGTRLGIGADLRWSTTKATLKPAGQTIKAQTGGAQVGGGIHILF